jgi:hypothetical protein
MTLATRFKSPVTQRYKVSAFADGRPFLFLFLSTKRVGTHRAYGGEIKIKIRIDPLYVCVYAERLSVIANKSSVKCVNTNRNKQKKRIEKKAVFIKFSEPE